MSDESLLIPCRTYHLYAFRAASRALAEPADRALFWKRYARWLHPFVDTYAYCLLPQRVHVLLRVRPSTSAGAFEEGRLQQVLAGTKVADTKLADAKRDRPDWKRRDVFSDVYAAHLVQFIHRSPVRHGFSPDVPSYPHSSFATLSGRRPTRLRREVVHAWFGGAEAFCDAHAQRWSGCAYPETPALDHVSWSVVS